MNAYLEQQVSLWQLSPLHVYACALMHVCALALVSLWPTSIEGKSSRMSRFCGPSAMRLFSHGSVCVCVSKRVNTAEFIHKCVCVSLQMSSGVWRLIPRVFSVSGSLFPPHCVVLRQNRGPAETHRGSIIHCCDSIKHEYQLRMCQTSSFTIVCGKWVLYTYTHTKDTKQNKAADVSSWNEWPRSN